jgi:hypothetical protein
LSSFESYRASRFSQVAARIGLTHNDVLGGEPANFRRPSLWQLAEDHAAALKQRNTLIRRAIGEEDNTLPTGRRSCERHCPIRASRESGGPSGMTSGRWGKCQAPGWWPGA